MLKYSSLPMVSILTPSYNAAAFIQQTIYSVLAQDYPYLEHIVVDAASTDGTVHILEKYNHCLHWVSEPDAGQSDALNKAIKLATGEIICWLNADDLFATRSSVRQAASFLIENPDITLLYSDAYIIDEKGQVVGQTYAPDFDYERLLLGNIIPGVTPFFRAEAIEVTGGFDVSLRYMMDYDLWLRIARHFRAYKFPEILGCFRLCTGTKSSEHPEHFRVEQIRIYDKLLDDHNLTKDETALVLQGYSRAHWLAGLTFYLKGESEKGREYCVNAIQEHSLLESDTDWALTELINAVFSSGVTDRYAFLDSILESLSRALDLREIRSKIVGLFYESETFRSYHEGEITRARSCFLKTLVVSPDRLGNLGLVSVGIELMAGSSIARILRRIARWFYDRTRKRSSEDSP